MMDKCPKCGKLSIPKYQKYLSGPASVCSCNECGAFIMISREAYVIIVIFIFIFLFVYLFNIHFEKNEILRVLLNTIYVIGFVFTYEKRVEWLLDPNMNK